MQSAITEKCFFIKKKISKQLRLRVWFMMMLAEGDHSIASCTQRCPKFFARCCEVR
jgi:hypothetical protein